MIKQIRGEWDSAMTGRERFNRQMHYKSVDRCFNMEFGYWDENFELWSMFKDNGIKNNDEADRFFGFDRFHVVWGDVFMSPEFKEEVIEVKGDKKIIQDRFGLLAEVPVKGNETMPHFLKSSIETPQDWEKIKKERFNRHSESRKVDVEAILKEHPNDRDYPLGVDCGSMIGRIRDMLTFEGLAYAMFDYPEMVEDMVETCCVLVEDFLDQVLGKIEFDFASGWEDICFKNGPIVTVPFFRDVVMPRYKRIKSKLLAHGIDIWFTDCDGDVRPILPYLLEGGINCLFPFEVNCCSHPSELLEKYHGELRIMGGFDKIEMGKGKEAIDNYFETLKPLVAKGGYIPFCDHRCPPNVKEEDYLYYLDKKRELFGKIS